MDDNDSACCLDERVVLEFIAGKPAPTGIVGRHEFMSNPNAVGASLLAMDDNDNECCLDERAALASIAGKPAPTGSGCDSDVYVCVDI